MGSDVPTINGQKLHIGMIQWMIFVEGDSQPHLDSGALPHYRSMAEAEKAKEIIRRKKKSDAKQRTDESAAPADDADSDTTFIIPGYIGKNKGIFQVLYERGLYLPKIKARQTQGTKEKLELKGKQDLIVPSELVLMLFSRTALISSSRRQHYSKLSKAGDKFCCPPLFVRRKLQEEASSMNGVNLSSSNAKRTTQL